MLSFGTNIVLALVTSIAIARLYGVETLGEYALALAPAGMLNSLSSFREQTALIRDLATLQPREPRVTALAYAVFAFSTALTVVVGTIATVIAYLVVVGPVGRPDLVAPTLVLMLNYVVVANTNWNLDAVLQGFRAGRQLYWIRLLQAASYLLLAAAAALVSRSVWAIVAATVGSALVTLLVRLPSLRAFMRVRVPRHELREGFRALPEMIRYGLKFTPGSMATGVSNEIGTWIVGVTSPVAAVGGWSRAWMLSRRLTEPSLRIAEVLFPTLVERRATRDEAGFDRAAIDSARYSAMGLLLLAAAGGGAAVGVMEVFGPGFARAADALALVLLLPAVFCVANVETTLLSVVDRPLQAAMLTVGRTVLVIVAAFPLGLVFGLTGVAAGYVAGYLADLAVRTGLTLRHLHRPLFDLWPWRQAAALVAAYAVGFGGARFVDAAVGGLAGTLLALAEGSIGFVGAYLAVGGLDELDRERLARLVARLRRARSAA